MLPKEICHNKIGVNGKCYWAYELGAWAIFNDCKAAIKECQQWGLDAYPINTKQEHHEWAGGGYETFADAVEAYLQKQAAKWVMAKVLGKALRAKEFGKASWSPTGLGKLPPKGLEKPAKGLEKPGAWGTQGKIAWKSLLVSMDGAAWMLLSQAMFAV